MKRRDFLYQSGILSIGLPLFANEIKPNFNTFFAKKPKVSLAQWSLVREFYTGKLNNLDFASKSKELGFSGIEYVNQFFKTKAKDRSYLTLMNQSAQENEQKNLLIMIDDEGELADPNKNARKTAIENHYKWVEAANFLGCHSIRVNLSGGKEMEEAKKAGIDSLNQLAIFSKDLDINIIVENHGGFSSNGNWLSSVMKEVSHPNIGTLPDFGNFCIQRGDKDTCLNEYDKYKGMTELIPFAKGLSAKSYSFDNEGNETTIDFGKMIKIAHQGNYNGYIGVEFEGTNLSSEVGIVKTRELLEKLINEIY